MIDETPKGWVKPAAPRTEFELRELISAKKAELQALELELHNLTEGPRLEAIAQIRNIMRAQQISLSEIAS